MRELSQSRRVDLQPISVSLPSVDWQRLAEYTALFLMVSAIWACFFLIATGVLH